MENVIVKKIMHAAHHAKIDDNSVNPEPTAGPRWNAALKSWYHKIAAAFEANNPERASKNVSLSQHIVGVGSQLQSNGSKIEASEALVQNRSEDKATIEILRDNCQLNADENRQLKHEVY